MINNAKPKNKTSCTILFIIFNLNSASSKFVGFESKHPQSIFIPLANAWVIIKIKNSNKAIEIDEAPFK